MHRVLTSVLLLAVLAGGCVSLFRLQDDELAVLEAVLAQDPHRPGYRLLNGRDLATFTDLQHISSSDEPYFFWPGPPAQPVAVSPVLLARLKPANRLGVSIPRAVRQRSQPDSDAPTYVAPSRPAFSAERLEARVAVSAHPKVAGCGWGYLVYLRFTDGAWHVAAIAAEYVT